MSKNNLAVINLLELIGEVYCINVLYGITGWYTAHVIMTQIANSVHGKFHMQAFNIYHDAKMITQVY